MACTLSAALLVVTGLAGRPLERALGYPEWRAQYAVISTIAPLADILRARAPAPLSSIGPEDLAVARQVVRWDELSVGRPFTPIIPNAYVRYGATSQQALAYLRAYARIAWGDRATWVRSRLALIGDIVGGAGRWWQYQYPRDRAEDRRLMDYGLLPRGGTGEAGPRGWLA